MKIKSISVFLITAAMFSGFAFSQPVASLNFGEYVEGEVLVKFKSGVSQQSGISKISAFGDLLHANIGKGLMHVKLNAGKSVQQTIADYANDPTVEYAQPNYIYHINAVPIASGYSQQWGFKNTAQTISNAHTQPAGTALYTTVNNPGIAGKDMNMEPAWGVITDCSNVVVAVVDSGVNYNHQELSGNMWTTVNYPNHGANFSGEGNTNDPMDWNGHGTHVAGIIGAAGNVTTGVCWKAAIMAVRVMDASGGGTTAHIVSGINFAVVNGAKVINMSLGGTNFDQTFSDAITAAMSSDVVVIVAAGNAGVNNDSGTPGDAHYPCNYLQANLICVAALDQAYGLASFSDYGTTSVDVGAPGTNILSTWAGSSSVVTDTLSSGWTFVNGVSGGWQYGTVSLTDNTTSPPTTFSLNTLQNLNYSASAAQHVYKGFDLSGATSAVMNFYIAGVVNVGDAVLVGMKSAGGDPFVGGTTLINGSLNSPSSFIGIHRSLTGCLTANCTLGYALTSAANSVGAAGPMVAVFSIDKLLVDNTSYNTIDGTSMATPAVAGLATMLRAYNPSFTYTDVVNTIKNSGTTTGSLLGNTSTGKAVNAMSALAYINRPTGLAATVK
jgi:subtilisin family serine protease